MSRTRTPRPSAWPRSSSAGRGPDIVAASGGNSLMQEAKDSGAFLELTPLLDELAPGLVPAVAEALRERPEIYDLPESFGINSFLAHPSQTGGRLSLTMEEAEACAAALGGAAACSSSG